MAQTAPRLTVSLWGPDQEHRALLASAAGLLPHSEEPSAALHWGLVEKEGPPESWWEIQGLWVMSGNWSVSSGWKPRIAAVFTLDITAEEIVSGLAAAAHGWTLQRHTQLEPVNTEEGLTLRERQVLELAAAGLPTKGIAYELDLNEGTIKFHLASIFRKTGSASRSQAVAEALKRGWIAG